MRLTTELFELESVFSWQTPLSVPEFLKACERRGLRLYDWFQLEALHRTGTLVPLFRFEKSKSLQTIQDVYLSHYLHGDVHIGTMKDPRQEPFRSWIKYICYPGQQQEWTSRFFYSRYQLLQVRSLRSLQKRLRGRRTKRRPYIFGRSFHYRLSEEVQARILEDARENDELVIVLSALETKYLPVIFDTLTYHRGSDFSFWYEYNRKFDPIAMLEWLKWKPEQIKKAAEDLLWTAHGFDPLDEWVDLVRLLHTSKWERLQGDALAAMDYRIAAEILLLFYKDLVEARAADPLEESPKYWRGPFDGRLDSDHTQLESTLMDFGISPHPSLILVLEGDTEMLLVPRVMELFNIKPSREHISLYNSKGIDKKLESLARYSVTPILGEAIDRGFILSRPPAYFLRVVDPESRLSTPGEREKYRNEVANYIWEGFEENLRSQISKSEIDHLIMIETWNEKGDSFEFAHFTDQEIAEAILSSYRRDNAFSETELEAAAPSLSQLESNVRKRRENKQNLKGLWERWKGKKPSKTRIAEELWPLLKRLIEKEMDSANLREIPVVRVVLLADERARQMHRRSVMIPKTEE